MADPPVTPSEVVIMEPRKPLMVILWRPALLEIFGSMMMVYLSGMESGWHSLASGGIMATIHAQTGLEAGAGYVNPAICIAGLVAGRMTRRNALSLCVAEVAGGFLSLVLLWGLGAPPIVLPDEAWSGTIRQLVVEVTMGFIIASVWSSMWRARAATGSRDRAAPLKAGFVALCTKMTGGLLSCAAGNPLHSIPIIMHKFDFEILNVLWPQWIGPLIGAAMGAATHRFIIYNDKPTPFENM